MSPTVCPHCESAFTPTKVDTDGCVHCEKCETTFRPARDRAPVGAAEPAPLAEAVPVASPAAAGAWDEIDDDDDEGDNPFRRGRDRGRRSRRGDGGENPWAGFGRGSQLVTAGIVVELVAVTLLLVVQLVFLVITMDRPVGRAPAAKKGTDYAYPVLSLVGLWAGVIGAGVVASGRSGQAKVPADRMGPGAAVAVASVGWISFGTAVVAGALFTAAFWAALADRPNPGGPPYASWAAVALCISLATRTYADLGSVIHLGVVSGVVPSRALRDRVGVANIALQVTGVCYLALLGIAYYYSSDGPGARPGPRFADRGEAMTAIVGAVVVAYLAVAAYQLVNLGLHATARRGADEWVPDPNE